MVFQGRSAKGSDHSLDRQPNKKSREKGNQSRKSEKSTISGQRSPFKSKYTNDKQFARTPFGHSGLSSKSFSRRHIQDNGTTFYAKPTKLGKIPKGLKKQQPPVEVQLPAKKGKSLKRYSLGQGSSDEQHPDDEHVNAPSSTSVVHSSLLDRNSNRSMENPPRHRKCYTNSKHAEFAKTLKLLDKGQSKDVKVSQSVGNLKRNVSCSDEMKYASADDIHSIAEKEDAPLSNKEIFSKTSPPIYKCANKTENVASNMNTSTAVLKPLTPAKNEMILLSSPGIDTIATDIDAKLEYNQPRGNSNYFCKGTDNQMNLEGSDISGVKILLRGDLLGALNCLFPQLNLVASESNPKRPVLDPNFSYFSDSSDILIETFALARKVCNEHTRKSAETTNILHKETIVDTCTKRQQLDDCMSERSKLNGSSQHLNLRNIVSAKELHSPPLREAVGSKLSSGGSSQYSLKSSLSEPRIPSVGIHYNTRLNNSLENLVDEQKRVVPASQDLFKNNRDMENRASDLEKTPANYEDNMSFKERNGMRSSSNNRSLYSSVLKNSMLRDELASVEKKSVHSSFSEVIVPQWDKISGVEVISDINSNSCDDANENTILCSQLDANCPTKSTPITDWRPPICYDLDELERDITKSLEKLVDESDDPLVLHQDNLQYSQPTPNPYYTYQTQKYCDNVHRRPPTPPNTGLASLQSRLNFLRTKGRQSDFEQFFNPLTFNTQLAAQFLRQDNRQSSMNTMPMDTMNNQFFPKADLAKLNPSSIPFYQQNPSMAFDRDIKDLLARCPRIVQNTTTSINQQNILSATTTNITASNPFDITSLYAHLAATKTQMTPLPQSYTKNNANDENMILNQFIASQSLEDMYTNNANLNRYSNNKFPNQMQFDYGKPSGLGTAGGLGMMDQDTFSMPPSRDHSGGHSSSGIRTIISVSDLEKQALEQYRNSEESINARYEVLEKEAEEQYNNCLSQK